MPKESAYCINHPSVKTNWRCIECDHEFCEDCVTPIRHSMSHISRFASCPVCKGQCFDFKLAGKVQIERAEEEKTKRIKVVKLLSAATIVTLLLILLFGLAPFELAIPVLLIMFVLAAVLLLQGRLDRGIGGDSVFSFADSYIDTDSLIRRKRPIITILVIVVILALLFFVFRFHKYGW